ncbi:MAG: exopolyphosphatase [Polaromonas sp.]|nr:exopolyphosphatase [Polaromonas sp.]
MQNGTLLAAVDLGSNSFRLEIGRYDHGHIQRVEYLKEGVRQGSGLGEDRTLNDIAMQRGWDCLARFAERIKGFDRSQVRAVATQTLREARNRDVFIQRAQQILGFPIEVISGLEEARLIYQGVSRLLPQSDERRLVVDIGGRSTELIMGQGFQAKAMDSFRLGSVAWSAKYFPNNVFTPQAFKTAEIAAQAVLDEALDMFPRSQWDVAYGSSGTVGAISDVLLANGRTDDTITREALDWLRDKLIKAQNVDNLRLEGIKDERKQVIGGGLSVLQAVFDLFDIEHMQPAQGALRNGALYDLIDRESDVSDVRERTVQWLSQRFSVDAAQARRVSMVASALFGQIAAPNAHNERHSKKLDWAARLHELGVHISHDDAHHHGAYVLEHVDAPGFSMAELQRLSLLVLGQRGKLRKLEHWLGDELLVKQLVCLRLAVLLCHARRDPDHRAISVQFKPRQIKLVADVGWAYHHPQSAWLIQEEALAWQKVGWKMTYTFE